MPQLTWEQIEQMDRRNKPFFRALGERVAQLRKENGLTQIQLAEMLKVSQQLITAYESGQRCIPADVLPRIATTLRVSMEELTGTNAKPAKRGPTPKFQRQLEQIARLPKTKQRFVMDMIDTVLQQASH
jgi:transcriptional regulator with XRE-family HTH domain